MKPKHAKSDPESAIDALIQSQIDLTLDDLIEHGPDEWEALLVAVRRQLERPDKSDLSVDERGAIEERVMQALPEQLQKAYVRLSDSRTAEETVSMQAAFALGLRYARLFGGAR